MEHEELQTQGSDQTRAVHVSPFLLGTPVRSNSCIPSEGWAVRLGILYILPSMMFLMTEDKLSISYDRLWNQSFSKHVLSA